MKILIHADEYYPTCAACAYRMKVFAEVLASKGHDVTVIASSTNRENGIIENCSERIIFAPTVRMKKKTAVMRMINNLSFAVSSVFASAKAGKADIVITTSPPPLVSMSGWLISKLKCAKLVYDVRDIWPDVAIEMNSFEENSFFCKVFRRITNFMYKHSDAVTTVSPGKVEKIKSKLPEKMRSKVWLVGNGFDENILNSKTDGETVKKYGLDESFTCVYIGNIGLAQGLGSLLRVAAETKHKNVKFLLFGEGAEKEQLKNRAREEKLDNVQFCGVLPHDKVYTVLTKAQLSFIALKNANMKDSVPTKIYEALGVGCPVLLVAEGDACSIVSESRLGECVSPDDIDNLSAVFDRMVENYGDFGENRLQSAELIKEKYSRQQIAARFEEKLQNLIL